MSHPDHTPDPDRDADAPRHEGRSEPEFGQRVEGAPAGPSYQPPQYGRGEPGGQYAAPGYGQDRYGQQGQYGQDPYGQLGQYGQDPYGQQGHYGQDPYGQQGQYGQGPYGQQAQYGQGPYGQQGQYGQGPYGQAPYGGAYQGSYDMGQYGAPSKPAGTGLGIAALVLGILALLGSWLFGLGFVPGVVGLVLGIVALRKLSRAQGASKAVPVIGIVLSALGIVASVLFFFAILSFMGPVLDAVNGPCSQYLDDQAALEQCLMDELQLNAMAQ
ncbi:DUF4190 domain-containing protein [Kocuria flava]|uniref:DUF4190 domain-containing protein n=1 Tax=Kocuria flava TaxID=446860 RepID=UPI001FF250D8|nr:DUF4190 domain-containing protein [Kocuria flava]MCJ8504467.1 DUF4190 domain-containing protein [Kocuria flava]